MQDFSLSLRKLGLGIAVLCVAGQSFAIEYDPLARPKSYALELSRDIDSIVLPPINLDSIRLLDEIEEAEGLPFRFGVAIPVPFSLENSGTWDTIDGGYLWRLRVISQGARSISVNYEEFEIPPGGSFFLFNPSDTHQVSRSYGSTENRNGGDYATGIVRGREVILEYFEPTASSKGKISVSSVVHGYRGIPSPEKDFGDAQECQINVSCPGADLWNEQTRSVVMIAIDSATRFCSGALINNTREDQAPYIFTAAHCWHQDSNPANWQFYFNYDPRLIDSVIGCDSTHDGNLNQVLTGSTRKAFIDFADESDNMLLRLDDSVPLVFNPYYAGWSSSLTAPSSTVTIHHPYGDVKKISFDDSAATEAGSIYTVWRVKYYPNMGTGLVEGGTSGAPLFDHNKRIIGAHSTDYSHPDTCILSSQTADFGNFRSSWSHYSDSSMRLKYWLDPDNSNVTTLNGFDPNSECCVGIRGNVNGAGGITVADITYLTTYLFNQGPQPPCIPEANVNGDANESVTVADLTYLVAFLFNGGPQPPTCP